MSTYFFQWTSRLAQRDILIEMMAFMAFGVVVLWCSVDQLPLSPTWRLWIKRAYRLCGLVLFVGTIVVAVRG